MSGNEPVRRFEFDLFREALRRELDGLRRDVDRLEAEHQTDMDDLAKADERRRKEKTESRQWTFGQLVAVVSAVAALGAFWLAAIGH